MSREIKIAVDGITGKQEYINCLELTDEVLDTIVEQNPLGDKILRTRSFNPNDNTFALEIIKQFVDEFGMMVTYNNAVIHGDIFYIKKAFLELSKKYRELEKE